FTIDTVVPSIPSLISPASNSFIATTTPNLQWHQSTNNLTNYIVYIDGTAKKTNSWTVSNWTTTALGQGIHTWRVKALDKVGQTNTSGTWTFTIDTVVPSIPSLISPASNSFIATTTPNL